MTSSKTSYIRIALCGVLSYLAAFATLAHMGLLTALPHVVLLSLAASFVCKKRGILYGFFGVFPFVLQLLYGATVSRAVILGVSCAAMAYFTVLAKRAFFTCKKGGDAVRSKSIGVLILAVIAAAVLRFAVFGNPVGLMMAEKENTDAISAQYGDTVVPKKSYYDVQSREYLTEITFDGGDMAERYYFAVGARDDYRDFCLDALKAEAAIYFEGKTTLDRSMVFCDIRPQDASHVFSPSDTVDMYLSDICYFYPVTDKLTAEEDFRGVVERLVPRILLSESFVFDSVIFAGVGEDGTPYGAVLLGDASGTLSYYNGDTDFYDTLVNRFPEAVKQ